MPPRGRAYSSRSRWKLLVALSVSVCPVSRLLGAAVLGLAPLALCGEAVLEAAVLEAAVLGEAQRAPSSVGSGSDSGGTWIACECVDVRELTSFRVTRCFKFFKRLSTDQEKDASFPSFFVYSLVIVFLSSTIDQIKEIDGVRSSAAVFRTDRRSNAIQSVSQFIIQLVHQAPYRILKA